MSGGQVVGVVCASGLVAVDAIAWAFGGIAIGSGDQCAGDSSVAGVAASVRMDAIGSINFIVATDAGGAVKNGCNGVVNRGLVVQIVEVMLGVALGAGPTGATVYRGIAEGFDQQDAGGGSVAGEAIFGLMNADSPVCFIMATKTGGGRQDDSIVMAQQTVDEEIGGVVGVAAVAITNAIDGGAVAIGPSSEFAVFSQVVAGAAAIVMQIHNQIATGVVACLAGAIGG